MKLNLKKLAGLVVAGAITIAGLTGISVLPASAALPTAATIRLISPTLTDDNSWSGQRLANTWIANQWFPEGLTYRHAWAPVGSTLNLTYHVTSNGTVPLTNTEVTLRVGKAYAGSSAGIRVNGVDAQNLDFGGLDYNPGDPFGRVGNKDQLKAIGTTDSFGNVTFTLENITAQDYPGVLPEAQPANFKTQGAKLTETGSVYTQVYPEVVSQAVDKADMTEVHFYTPTTPADVSKPAAATTTLQAPALTDSNSIARGDLTGSGSRTAYAEVGSKVNLVYHVADGNGTAIAGVPFKLHVNRGYSKSNAKVTNGTIATDSSIDNSGASDQALWTATTDAWGNASFLLTNTDTAGESKAATTLGGILGANNGGKFSQLLPEVATVDTTGVLDLHFFVQTKVTLSASGRSVKVTVVNGKSKKATITITGLKKASKTATSDRATTFKFTVAKGKRTVKVVVNGTTFTKTFTIK